MISCTASTSEGSIERMTISGTQRFAREQPIVGYRPMPRPERARASNRLADIPLRLGNRVLDCLSARQPGGNRRREGAAGAARSGRLITRRLELQQGLRVEKQVHRD